MLIPTEVHAKRMLTNNEVHTKIIVAYILVYILV